MTQKDDHDLLIRIDENLSNFIKRFEDHEREDKKLNDKVEFHSKLIYGALGIVAFLQFINIFK